MSFPAGLELDNVAPDPATGQMDRSPKGMLTAGRSGSNVQSFQLQSGTGSAPEPPQGWQRVIRRNASQLPLIAPCLSNASNA